jgi:hypothetical protein
VPTAANLELRKRLVLQEIHFEIVNYINVLQTIPWIPNLGVAGSIPAGVTIIQI